MSHKTIDKEIYALNRIHQPILGLPGLDPERLYLDLAEKDELQTGLSLQPHPCAPVPGGIKHVHPSFMFDAF